VIATQDEEVFRVFNLVGKEETNCFKGLFSPVHVVAEEQVVGFWWEATVFKKSEEVVILAMYVAFKENEIEHKRRVV
jgi:hypothetical protein